jgi:hypothetical protein
MDPTLTLVPFGGNDVPGPGVMGLHTVILQFLSRPLGPPSTLLMFVHGLGQVQTVLVTAGILVSVPTVSFICGCAVPTWLEHLRSVPFAMLLAQRVFAKLCDLT